MSLAHTMRKMAPTTTTVRAAMPSAQRTRVLRCLVQVLRVCRIDVVGDSVENVGVYAVMSA